MINEIVHKIIDEQVEAEQTIAVYLSLLVLSVLAIGFSLFGY